VIAARNMAAAGITTDRGKVMPRVLGAFLRKSWENAQRPVKICR
jgi:hypothetical protein